jgi:predicted small lipoprotein YifL
MLHAHLLLNISSTYFEMKGGKFSTFQIKNISMKIEGDFFMFKKFLAILLVLTLLVGLTACGQKPAATEEPAAKAEEPAPATEEPAAKTEEPAADGNWKIGIMTGTVSQNEEEYRAAERVLKEYGKEHIMIMTYPDKFMDEQETTIANVASMAEDPDCKAIIFVQAVPGASAAIDKAREINPDLLVIAGQPGEDPGTISSKADIVLSPDDLGMGTEIPAQAKKQGAKVFVHYSFPRHMSYALLSARRDIFKEECKKLGMEFVDATAPDPTGDAGVPGAQQFILEDVPRMVEKYGKDTAFFSTNCAMQVPLIKSVVDQGAIYPQPCCPSPYHGFPSALGIEIPEDKQGDVAYVVDEITAKMKAAGMEGRTSTWPVPVAMMFIEAGADYAKAYIDGETEGKFDQAVLKDKFEAYAETEIKMTSLEENGNKYDNYIMVLLDFLTF